MENHPVLDAQTLLSSQADIKEVINKTSVTFSTLTIFIGFCILCTGSFVEDKSSGLYLAIVSLPFLLLFAALFRLIYKRKQLVYSPTGSPVKEGLLYFDKSQLEVIETMLKSDSSENIEWTGFHHTGNARLHYWVSQDARFAAVQLYEYIPYHYQVASDIYTYSSHREHPIAHLLLQR